jgi:hypothetical protein
MLHKHMEDGKRVHCKETYNCCSLTSLLTCLIDLVYFCGIIFYDSLASLHTSMMAKIGGTSLEGGVDTL